MNELVGGLYSGLTPVQSSAPMLVYCGSMRGSGGARARYARYPAAAAVAATKPMMPRITGIVTAERFGMSI